MFFFNFRRVSRWNIDCGFKWNVFLFLYFDRDNKVIIFIGMFGIKIKVFSIDRGRGNERFYIIVIIFNIFILIFF